MANHLAIERGVLYPQPGATVKVDKEGKWTASQNYLCHRLDAVKLMPRPGTVHPDITFIECCDASINFDEGDIATIVCQYAGCEDKEDEEDEKANAVFSMDLSLTEEPILLHKRYKNLAASEKEALGGILKGKDKDDQGNNGCMRRSA